VWIGTGRSWFVPFSPWPTQKDASAVHLWTLRQGRPPLLKKLQWHIMKSVNFVDILPLPVLNEVPHHNSVVTINGLWKVKS
jgi:hypothetical protein